MTLTPLQLGTPNTLRGVKVFFFLALLFSLLKIIGKADGNTCPIARDPESLLRPCRPAALFTEIHYIKRDPAGIYTNG